MKKSFTLIELLIVLVVTAIMVTLALPKFEAFVYNMHGTEAMNNLRAMADSVWRYYLEAGSFPQEINHRPDGCDIELPHTSKYWNYSYNLLVGPDILIIASNQALAPIGGFYRYDVKIIGTQPPSEWQYIILGEGYYMYFIKYQKISNKPPLNYRIILKW